jgi:hypothetical protein
VIRNTVVGTSPLVVNSIASTTANLTEFQVNGTKVLEVTPAGGLNQNGTRLFSQPVNTDNTFFGFSSGNSTSTTGSSNTGLGAGSLFGVTSGFENTGVGVNSLRGTTTGFRNTGVGINASRNITTGNANTFVGQDSGFNVSQLATANNSTAIGNGSFTDKSNQMVFGNASVSEFKFDRNTGAIALLPQIITSSSEPNLFNRTSTITNSFRGHDILHTTNGDMVDGFGSIIGFNIRDNANVINTIGYIGSVRSGADSSGRLVFNTATTGSLTEKMTILPNGNIGIGTASPSAKLDVQSAQVTFRDNTTTTTRLDFDLGVDVPRMTFYNSNTANFEIAYRGAFAPGPQNIGTLTVNTNNPLSFGTNATERMRITSDGNVGIGTTSPAQKLDVVGKIRVTDDVVLAQINGRIDYDNNNAGGSLRFFSTSSAAERMRITASGNVGIGTSAPAQSLTITREVFPSLGLYSTFNFDENRNWTIRTNAFGDGNWGGLAILQSNAKFADPTLLRFGIDTAGRVGIGIPENTAVSAQLQVKSGATTRVPLIVDSLTSQTANLQEWKVNGSNVITIANNGNIGGNVDFITNDKALRNFNGATYASVAPTFEGTKISRNIADTNPALIVNLASSTATGNIQVWQKATDAKSFIDNRGQFYKNEVRLTLTEPTFTNPSTGLFVYTITSTQLNDNDEIYIIKTATADNQTYKVVVPNTSKNVRIWVRILPGGFNGTTNLLETAKSTSEFVKLVFEESTSFGGSNFYDGTESYLATNIDHALLFENINGKQKCITEVYINEI